MDNGIKIIKLNKECKIYFSFILLKLCLISYQSKLQYKKIILHDTRFIFVVFYSRKVKIVFIR